MTSYTIESELGLPCSCCEHITIMRFFILQDLFASAAKSKPKPQGKANTPQPSKGVSSSLFSDDEVCCKILFFFKKIECAI